MGTKFFTNEDGNTLLAKFKGVFESNNDIEWFDALVGYFRSSGFFAIRPYLQDVSHIRVLVGIDVDSILARYNDQGLLFRGDHEATVREALLNFKRDIAKCSYSRQVEDGICRFVEDVAAGKVEVRAHKSRRLHAKIYIFRPKHWNEHHQGSVITGSSNLTDAGLGAGVVSNYEFNVLLNDYDDVAFATSEFEKLWGEAVSILPERMDALISSSHLNNRITPFQVYIKMLSTYFGKAIDFNPDAMDIPKGFKKFSYQIDAVNQGYDKLSKYNGFFLADVVGLGKTVVALMIARKFFYGNGFPDHISRILVICPPAVKSSWEETINSFGLKTCKIITNGSIHKLEKRFSIYDLVIVDEAHKFRNSSSVGYGLLQRLCKSKAPAGGTVGKLPERKKVILISATPLNNAPSDIQSQVYLFQDGGDTDLDIPNLDVFFKDLTHRFKEATALPFDEAKPIIAKINEEMRESIISPLTVRRTRADLMANKMYREDLKNQHVIFPEIAPPVKMFYTLDQKLDFLFDRTLETLTKKLNYSRYRAIAYLKPEQKKRYKTADIASIQLPKLMKALLVKRLDSSFYAFKASLHNFRQGVDGMLKMLQNGQVIILHDVDVTSYVLEDRMEELFKILEQKQKSTPGLDSFTSDDFESAFQKDLQKDLAILSELDDEWKGVNNDPKYDEFKRQLDTVLLNRRHNPSHKVIVFSEAEDTTLYIADRLRKDGVKGVLAVHSGNRDKLENIIKDNFDANQEKAKQRDEYNIIISTEALAEGINLHRAAVVVNYDTPWNSIRLMQRVGRINRIGSSNSKLYIHNFFPTSEVDNEIELEKKASLKLLAFHHALGSDSQIYSPDDEKPGSFGLFDVGATDEQDERLRILLWLRAFREEYPERFKMISDLPLKIRCGREEAPETLRAEATVAYLRNSKRDLFFAVDAQNPPRLLSFLEAEKLLRCGDDTSRRDIPESHYGHINLAIKEFEKKGQEGASQRNAIRAFLMPNEKKALNYLECFKTQKFVNSDEVRLLEQAQNAIRQRRFAALYKEINKLHALCLTPIDSFKPLLEVIEKYPVEIENADPKAAEAASTFSGGTPDIVISETIVHTTNLNPQQSAGPAGR